MTAAELRAWLKLLARDGSLTKAEPKTLRDLANKDMAIEVTPNAKKLLARRGFDAGGLSARRGTRDHAAVGLCDT